MVRYLLQGRLARVDRLARVLLGPIWGVLAGLQRFLRLWLRWLLVWLAHGLRSWRLAGTVGARVTYLLLHPADPNNLFTLTDAGAYTRPEAGRQAALAPLAAGERRPNLLMQDGQPAGAAEGGAGRPPVLAISLTRGTGAPDGRRVAQATRAVNYRHSLAELLQTEIRRMKLPEIQELGPLINRLARRWLDMDQEFEAVARRSRLDLRRTMKANIGRYAGHVLDFKWATREVPVPRLSKPARVLVIGDVSHSMYHYVTISLYFFHLLNFRFQVNSYVFSERATRATEILNGPGSFTEKVQELVRQASSWNAGTRFGSSLQEILAEARIDPYTYVVIATDGKVALGQGEYEKIHRQMARLKSLARMVVFMTPEAGFAGSHGSPVQVAPVGAFKSGVLDIPIFDLGQIWYNTLGKYADRVYHVRTVQDLVSMCEDLYLASRD